MWLIAAIILLKIPYNYIFLPTYSRFICVVVNMYLHLGGTLEKTRVEVEHITGVGLTTGGTTQQQGHLNNTSIAFRNCITDNKLIDFRHNVV